jgi:hypothetical protein
MSTVLEDLEHWAIMGLIGVDTQVYDLTQVTDFVAEIADAADQSDAPVFNAGLVPAESAVVLLAGYQPDDREAPYIAMYLHREADRRIRCSTMHVRAHNLVTGMMMETADKVRDLLAAGTLPKHLQPTVDYLDENDWMDPTKPENQIRPDEIFEVGALVPSDRSITGALARMASAACEFMAMPIAARAPAALPRPARRRLERTGKRVLLTNVSVTRSVAAGRARGVQHGEAGRALHFVSGHWRVSPTSFHAQMVHGQLKIWIDGFWRGDPEYGVVLHRYLARKRNAA